MKKKPVSNIKNVIQNIKINQQMRDDPYHWLRDDARKDINVMNHLKKENNYTKKIMLSKKKLKNKIFQEIINRIPRKDCSLPYIKNKYLYQKYYKENSEYPIYRRQSIYTTKKDKWEKLLDPNKFILNKTFYSIGHVHISPNNNIMAISEDVSSNAIYRIRFKNLKEKYWYKEVLEYVSETFSWFNDSKNLLYILKNKINLLPFQVWKHTLGTLQCEDELIYEEKDNTFHINMYKTTSEKYIVININQTNTSETLLIDANNKNSQPKIFFPRKKNHEYFLDHYKKYFYFQSNQEGKNFGIYRVLKKTKNNWETYFKPKTNILIEDYQLFHHWLVLKKRKNGLSYISYMHLKTKKSFNIDFHDPNYVIWLSNTSNPSTSKLRYIYSSLTTPDTIFELNMNNGKKRILKQLHVSSFKSDQYKSEYIWIQARDGVKIPVSLVYHKKYFKCKNNPLIIYAYGAYGVNVEASFSHTRLSLLDRGFIYAIAHVRGGSELGQIWYYHGRLLKKMNTFNDFIDVTQALLHQGYGDKKRTYAIGESAGGLLVGAVINFMPKLWHGAIAHVPFVDVLNTMLDPTIPLTTGEYDEWGNPKEKKYYDYIKKYSPYDNVSAQEYPNLFVTSGLHDTQVQYWEPAKWVAKLRAMKTDKNLLIFYTDMHSGHSGKSGRFDHYNLIALEYTFLISLSKNSLK